MEGVNDDKDDVDGIEDKEEANVLDGGTERGRKPQR